MNTTEKFHIYKEAMIISWTTNTP